MEKTVLKVLALFSSLHYVVNEVVPSSYLPYELVQWTNVIESFIKTGFIKPPAYTFGDAQCALSRSHHDFVLEKISPRLHDIWDHMKAKYVFYRKRYNLMAFLKDKLDRIDDRMSEVREGFEGLMKLIPTDDRSLDKKTLCDYTMGQLRDDNLKKKIDSMRREIINQKGYDVLSAIIAELQPGMFCHGFTTGSDLLYSIHSELMSMEIGGYITMIFSYWYLFKYNGKDGCTFPFPKDPDAIIAELHDTFKQKMIEYAEKFYPAWSEIHDDYQPCFPRKAYRDINYIELEGVIQTVVLPAADAGGKCEDIDMQGVDWTKYCEPYPNNHHCLGIERPCLGRIWRCQSRDAGEVCMDSFTSSRRYKWIAPQNNTVTTSETCSQENLLQMSWKGRKNCVCLCVDNEPDSMSTHIFNLRPVEADVNENKVVTGVRVLVDHGVVHLQIKQGILKHHWQGEDSDWKEIDDISEEIYAHRLGTKLHGKEPEVTENVDYYVVPHPARFDVDVLRVPANHVLTGVKFHYGDDKRLQIAILTREYNPVTGELTISKDANIVTGQQGKRWDHYGGWFPFKNMDKHLNMDITGEGYVVFTETWWDEGDSGQTTVPFFDPRHVESFPVAALGGFGFIFRAGVDRGFALLSPVVYSVDYGTYIKNSSDRLKK